MLQGKRTSQGNPFNKSSITRIIQNEMYRGVYSSRAYNVRIEGAIPAIIDADLWERAQTMLKINRQLKAKHEPKADYILSGKLFCGQSGRLMKGVSGHSGGNGEVYRYYTCSNPQCHKHNVPKSMLENKVFCSICDNLLHPAAMEALADAMMEVQKTDSQKPDLEREALERELRDVQRRSKNIMDAIETGSANPQLIARLEITDSELLIYFNISENTENKNKNAPQQNFTKESSTEMRLVRVARVELTAS